MAVYVGFKRLIFTGPTAWTGGTSTTGRVFSPLHTTVPDTNPSDVATTVATVVPNTSRRDRRLLVLSLLLPSSLGVGLVVVIACTTIDDDDDDVKIGVKALPSRHDTEIITAMKTTTCTANDGMVCVCILIILCSFLSVSLSVSLSFLSFPLYSSLPLVNSNLVGPKLKDRMDDDGFMMMDVKHERGEKEKRSINNMIRGSHQHIIIIHSPADHSAVLRSRTVVEISFFLLKK